MGMGVAVVTVTVIVGETGSAWAHYLSCDGGDRRTCFILFYFIEKKGGETSEIDKTR
jgi:hypothetical protein